MPSLLGTETAPRQLKSHHRADAGRYTEGTQHRKRCPRTFPSMLPAYGQKHRNDGGELSRQWNTQPARPTTGSPACSDTRIRRERQPQNLQESAAHRSQTPVRGTIHCLGNSYASATSRRCSACRYSRRPCLPSTSCGTQPTRSTRLQHARTPARHEPPPSHPYAPCTPHASAHESGE